MTNAEADVIAAIDALERDEIDELVDAQLRQERSGYDHNINQDRCPKCRGPWHGLRQGDCPGATGIEDSTQPPLATIPVPEVGHAWVPVVTRVRIPDARRRVWPEPRRPRWPTMKTIHIPVMEPLSVSSFLLDDNPETLALDMRQSFRVRVVDVQCVAAFDTQALTAELVVMAREHGDEAAELYSVRVSRENLLRTPVGGALCTFPTIRTLRDSAVEVRVEAGGRLAAHFGMGFVLSFRGLP